MCSRPSEPSIFWKYLNLLKVLNFRQHLWLTKRKTKWQAAGIVGHSPPSNALFYRHLRPRPVYILTRYYTELTGASSATHSASNGGSQAHSNAVYWTATSVTIFAYLQNFWLLEQMFISWKHTNVSAHWTELTLPVWWQVTSSLQNFSTSII